MAAPRKYPDELRERAIRLVLDARRDPVSRPAACRRIGDQLGINPETLRGWVNQAETDAGNRPGTTTSDAQRMAELEREVRELRRAKAILKAASAFFASVPDWMVARRGWLVSSLPSWLVRDVPSRRVGAAGRGRGLIGACLLTVPD